MANLSFSVTNKIEKSIREAERFQYIASDKTEAIIEALRMISIRSGMATYIWLSKQGLVNIKSKQSPLPATKSVLEALKYASNNPYFAVYIFPAMNAQDLMEIKSTLPSALTYLKNTEKTRFLFLIETDEGFNYIKNNAEQIVLADKNTQKYKLRDAKWVLADE